MRLRAFVISAVISALSTVRTLLADLADLVGTARATPAPRWGVKASGCAATRPAPGRLTQPGGGSAYRGRACADVPLNRLRCAAHRHGQEGREDGQHL
ncbi:hypothetical protein GL263_10325 [Streptomyces durbertensis]|uniref:Secreted protein n=1 Tax=Streptomyces durbertensis TaxID=2448886 RepID=A0ABR6EF27_9ACTN|nr:hypothetical protein [Streptomyces durbertensis]MBB1243948.1 hypothetical protein [Streptomyces durbertensis]